jgi:hypothetical protein
MDEHDRTKSSPVDEAFQQEDTSASILASEQARISPDLHIPFETNNTQILEGIK